jgi:glycolate oxidase FAD binding subunit
MLAVESMQLDLNSMLGEARVVTDPAVCASLAVDGVTPKCVAYPSSDETVASVLKYAAEHDLAVIPCRNATKLGVGNAPHRYDIALSLKELNRVWHYEPADLTITVEAGMKFGDFQHFVSKQRLWLPLDPAGGSRASVGGILATNSTSTLRALFGAPRDMVLGMKIATTQGKLVKTGGRVVKNVAGYDLGKLLIGSYGTLGVIVEASLKLYPLPAARATYVLRAPTLDMARDLRRRILHSPLDPLRLTLLDAKAAALTRRGSRLETEGTDNEIWLEFGGSPRVIDRCERDLQDLGSQSAAPLQRWAGEVAEFFWGRISDPISWLSEVYHSLIVLKALLPIAATEDFMSLAQQEVGARTEEFALIAQPANGVIQLCLLQHTLQPGATEIVNRLRQSAEGLSGSLVVEKCPVELKQQTDVWGNTGDDFTVMRKVKAVWDPKGNLAAERLVGKL